MAKRNYQRKLNLQRKNTGKGDWNKPSSSYPVPIKQVNTNYFNLCQHHIYCFFPYQTLLNYIDIYISLLFIITSFCHQVFIFLLFIFHCLLQNHPSLHLEVWNQRNWQHHHQHRPMEHQQAVKRLMAGSISLMIVLQGPSLEPHK